MKNPHAVALGRLGGLSGGKRGGRARAAALSPERRREIARDAARARWRGLPALLRPLFPGHRLEDIVLPQHQDMVMRHVLGRGGPEHIRWLVRRFSDKGIRDWLVARKGRGLAVAQMAPWVPRRTARAWQAKDPYAQLWENR